MQQHPVEVILDLALENDNRIAVQPIVNESPADVLGILKHPRTLATFSIPARMCARRWGRHCRTHLLSYCGCGRKQAVHARRAGADTDFRQRVGLGAAGPRAWSRTGYAADLVVERGRHREAATAGPSSRDLPGGARRLVQKADGIAATVVNGVVAIENGAATGEHGGQVLKRLAA